MEILEGLLFINDVDIYVLFGAFLAEKEAGGHANFDALFRPSRTKEQVAINVREMNGELLPDVIDVRFEARDVTLYFGMEAEDAAAFLEKRAAFINFLREGIDGWLNMRLAGLGITFRFYLKEFGEWEQLAFQDGISLARFPVVFREPVPIF